MKSLNIEEVHDVLLNIAKAFITICDNNNIPYYMGYGTLLGAIRHKGFIPWDDDMDFCVPRPYYQKLIRHLEKELPYPYRCCTYKNGLNNCIILKIDDARTLIKDVCVLDKKEQNKGINIDIFPLDYVNPSSCKLKVIKFLLRLSTTIYTANSNGSKWKNSLKRIVSSIFPISRNTILSKVENMLENVKVGNTMVNVLGIYKNLHRVKYLIHVFAIEIAFGLVPDHVPLVQNSLNGLLQLEVFGLGIKLDVQRVDALVDLIVGREVVRVREVPDQIRQQRGLFIRP